MREEKRCEIMQDALNFLDDELIEEVENLRGGFVAIQEPMAKETVAEMKKKAVRKSTAWRKWTSLAASVGLLILVGSVWTGLNYESEDMNMDMENQEGIQDTAEQEATTEKDNKDEFVDSDEKFQSEGEKLEAEDLLEEIEQWDYLDVYYGDKLLTGELHDMMAKFMESYQNGTVRIVDVSSSIGEDSDGHLYFKLSDGSTKHLVLLGDGIVFDYENPTVWVQMDTRIYNLFVELLKEEM